MKLGRVIGTVVATCRYEGLEGVKLLVVQPLDEGLKPDGRPQVAADATAQAGPGVVVVDPLEWLARMADHIPDPGKHRTLFYSYYANRVRGNRAAEEPGEGKLEEEPAKKRRCTASWARLIAKVFHADPLTCGKCGGKLKIVAYLHDTVAIKQVLAHLGLSPPEEPKPPPAVHEVVRVPVDEEGHRPPDFACPLPRRASSLPSQR